MKILPTRREIHNAVKVTRQLRFLGRAHKLKRYVRRDRNGRIVTMDMGAEATKEYLEKDQWEKKDKALTTEPRATERTSSSTKSRNKRPATNTPKTKGKEPREAERASCGSNTNGNQSSPGPPDPQSRNKDRTELKS